MQLAHNQQADRMGKTEDNMLQQPNAAVRARSTAVNSKTEGIRHPSSVSDRLSGIGLLSRRAGSERVLRRTPQDPIAIPTDQDRQSW